VGLPPLKLTDHFIVGSRESRRTLHTVYGVRDERIFTLPYPIDLQMFRTEFLNPARAASPSLRVCWLGRIIPRKRLDLFLDGAALAVRRGVDVHITVVGGIGFVPGYEKLIEAFPYPDRLRWEKGLPRDKVPAFLGDQDVLIQPSDEENFGSSVAEAQACGLPVIIGRTNGNADYLCSRDIHLRDDRPETLAVALSEFSRRKAESRWGDPGESRRCAEQYFTLEKVTLTGSETIPTGWQVPWLSEVCRRVSGLRPGKSGSPMKGSRCILFLRWRSRSRWNGFPSCWGGRLRSIGWWSSIIPLAMASGATVRGLFGCCVV
jgi:glycosyltransferase involved in cell wall biosynthesis